MKNMWLSSTIVVSCTLILAGCASKEGASKPDDQDSIQSQRPEYIGNSPVRLNEIVPVNTSLEDHQGDDPAWIEVYNPADTAVNLAGYALTDDLEKPRQWVFGDLIVPPKGYQLVFLSGKNITRMQPASDSMNLMSASVWDWNDSYRNPDDGEPGNSSSLPFEYPEIAGKDSLGRPVISAILTLGDNMGLSDQSLRWSSSQVGMALPGAPLDISSATVAVIRGYIQNGRELTVRFAQGGMDSWLCWAQVIRGNGMRNGEYRINLPQGTTFPNLKDMRSIQFEATTPYLSSIRFTIQDMYVLDVPMMQHANFKMGRKASTLYLLDSAAIRDSLAYPEMDANLGWGYDVDGKIGYLKTTTPWNPAMDKALAERMPSAISVQAPGFYPSPIEVALQIPEGAQVYYTLDGSVPTLQSTSYKTPIPLSKTTVIRSFVHRDGSLDSPVLSQTFFIADSTKLPVVSIATDPAGLFSADSGIFMPGLNPGEEMPHYGANFWAPKELPVSVEFFDEKGVRSWNMDAGISIFGNYSRNNEKKAVSIKFREKYGKNQLKYPMFPDHPEMKEFRTLALRANGGNNGSDYIRDALAQDLAEGLDLDYQRNRLVVVYYNGEYFGIYQLLQKMDSHYPETAFGIAEENVELVEPIKNVTTLSYSHLESFIESMDSSHSEADARSLDSLMDLQSALNYMALQFYVANTDWPANNFRMWRSLNPPRKWRYMVFDMDFGFGSNNGNNPVDFDMFRYMLTPTVSANGDTANWPNGTRSTAFYRKALLENRELHTLFLNRIVLLLAKQFESGKVRSMVDSMMLSIQSEIPRDQQRWKFSEENMNNHLEIIQNWAAERPSAMRAQLRQHFGLGKEVNSTLGIQGPGTLEFDGFPLAEVSITGPWLTGQIYTINAVPRKGASFMGWSDGERSPSRKWSPEEGSTLTAIFL